MKEAGRTKDPDDKASNEKEIKKKKEQKRGTKKNHTYR